MTTTRTTPTTGPVASTDQSGRTMTTTRPTRPARPTGPTSSRSGPRSHRARRWVVTRACAARSTVLERRDDGMATAEYAIATIAAVGFAGLLIAVLKSETVKGLLSGLISSALSIG